MTPLALVIDEVGYLHHGDDAANVLYGVVDGRCLKRRPTIFTTNKPISRWGQVLHDNELAEALLDRVLERGTVIHLRGKSYRTRDLDLTMDEAPCPETRPETRPESSFTPS